MSSNPLFNSGRSVRACVCACVSPPVRAFRCLLRVVLHTYVRPTQPVTLDCNVLFPLGDPDTSTAVLSTLNQFAASVAPSTCDPFIREETFKADVITSLSPALGARVAAGEFLQNNTQEFMRGSTQGVCAAAVCLACRCREGIVPGAGGGYGADVAQGSECGTYATVFQAQDDLRYIILFISIITMLILLAVRARGA